MIPEKTARVQIGQSIPYPGSSPPG